MSAPCPICDCERLAKVQDDAGGGAPFAVAFMLGRAFDVDAIKERLCPRHRNRWLSVCYRCGLPIGTKAHGFLDGRPHHVFNDECPAMQPHRPMCRWAAFFHNGMAGDPVACDCGASDPKAGEMCICNDDTINARNRGPHHLKQCPRYEASKAPTCPCNWSIGESCHECHPRDQFGDAPDPGPRPSAPDREASKPPERIFLAYDGDPCEWVAFDTAANAVGKGTDGKGEQVVEYAPASALTEALVSLRALVNSLPKCDKCSLPATRAWDRGRERYCDKHRQPGYPPHEGIAPEYPRAEPVRRAQALLARHGVKKTTGT